ncbi:MAG: hypothetical protein WDO18_07860 [Acidobacteriota bacterium]
MSRGWLWLTGTCFLLTASAADLGFQRITLLDYEDGPPLTPGYEYRPGETVWFNARVTGFQRDTTDKDEATDHVRLTWQIRPQDPAGTLLVPTMRGVIEETLRPEDKTWMPKVLVSFLIPPFAPRGTYRIPLTVRDDLAKKEASGQVEFRVRGDDPVLADATFGLRNFRFLAREDDRFPLKPAVFKPGAPMFARFDVVGYKFEGNNHFSIGYGIAILGPPDAEGVQKTVLSQDPPTQEESESFYAQRWVPGGFGLTLDPTVAPGEYTLVVTVQDKVAGATTEVKQTFEILP